MSNKLLKQRVRNIVRDVARTTSGKLSDSLYIDVLFAIEEQTGVKFSFIDFMEGGKTVDYVIDLTLKRKGV